MHKGLVKAQPSTSQSLGARLELSRQPHNTGHSSPAHFTSPASNASLCLASHCCGGVAIATHWSQPVCGSPRLSRSRNQAQIGQDPSLAPRGRGEEPALLLQSKLLLMSYSSLCLTKSSKFRLAKPASRLVVTRPRSCCQVCCTQTACLPSELPIVPSRMSSV